MAAKTAVALRLSPEVIAKVDAYAKARETSRQVVLETFVLSGLDDSERGMVDLVAPEPRSVPKPKAVPAQQPETWEQIMWSRQQRLNNHAAS